VRVVSSRDQNVRDHEQWHAAVAAALPPEPTGTD
jgi:hypothetical protein